MPDREKVIKGLEEISDYFFSVYHHSKDREEINKAKDMCDAVEDALALLKEQEAVPPERESSGGGITWWNVCGACRVAINPNDKYCHECGRPVKWT